MTINEAKVKGAEILELGARAFKDKGYTAYEAQHHAALMGQALAAVIEQGMEPTASNLAAWCHAFYNHSAWRQKFEKQGIFPKAEARAKSGLDNLLAELKEEGV